MVIKKCYVKIILKSRKTEKVTRCASECGKKFSKFSLLFNKKVNKTLTLSYAIFNFYCIFNGGKSSFLNCARKL